MQCVMREELTRRRPRRFNAKAQGRKEHDVRRVGTMLCGDDLNVVKAHVTVLGDQSQTFLARLSNEHTVKWVVVMWRQCLNSQSMVGGDAERRESVEMKLLVILKRRHFELAASSLDRYFPRGDSANVHDVTAVDDCCSCSFGQPRVIADCPEEGMGIK